MFGSAGEQGWGKCPGKLPSPSLWVPGEGEGGPLLNLASAVRSSGGAAPGWGWEVEENRPQHRSTGTAPCWIHTPAPATVTPSKEQPLYQTARHPQRKVLGNSPVTENKEGKIPPDTLKPHDAFDSTPGPCGGTKMGRES